ncbi:hypothetical protein MPTK1_Vg00120 [Marchantia polymorpha subsp. ruderalis]
MADRELRIAARRARIAASLRASHASNANEEATSKMNNENGNKVLAKTQELAANALKRFTKARIIYKLLYDASFCV